MTLSYQRRIAELQARYRLLLHPGPVLYACQGQANNELQVGWFDTQPPTLDAARGDTVSLMFLECPPLASGELQYVGRNESLRRRNPDLLLVPWGVIATAMRCEKQP